MDTFSDTPTPAAPDSEAAVADLLGLTATGTSTTPAMSTEPHMRAPAVPIFDPRPPAPSGTGEPAASPVATVAGRPRIERLLASMVRHDGSDLHLVVGQPPFCRIAGELLPVAGENELDAAGLDELLREVVSPEKWSEFLTCNDLDTSYEMRTSDGAAVSSRFRLNYFTAGSEHAAVFRVIPSTIPSLDDLGVLPVIRELSTLPRGMVLFCGPTGSGKSSTAAGLLREINETRTERIITLEDPVEFKHPSKKSLISHREVGADVASFAEGLRRVRREDPDVIYIGEMRDTETLEAGIEAADTGHFVISTLHTNSAPETISRIVNSFPPGRQEQIRVTLASCLRAVVCQVLVPSVSAPRGRVLASEVMVVTPAIAHGIRENDIPAITNALSDTSAGSVSLDAHLAELVRSNQVTRLEATKKASSPTALDRILGAAPTTRRIL